jgi:hypothetical protein
MKHPRPEQWMEFLYDEIRDDDGEQIREHLSACPECRAKQREYESGMRALNSWRIEPSSKNRLIAKWVTSIKWAAAAALLLATGFASGMAGSRWTQGHASVQAAADRAVEAAQQKLKAELSTELQQISEKAIANVFVANQRQFEQLGISIATLQDEHKRSIYAALQELENKRASEYHSLRQDLEKVAVFTDANLKYAQRQLVQLANYSGPQN